MGGIIFTFACLMILTIIALIWDFIINDEIKVINKNHVKRRSRIFSKIMINVDIIYLILLLIALFYIASEF